MSGPLDGVRVVDLSRAPAGPSAAMMLTGTPAGVGPLQAGDQVTVTIEGIGSLSTRVVGG